MKSITLNELETQAWEGSGPIGEAFRRGTRAQALALSRRLARAPDAPGPTVEIYSQDGAVLDALAYEPGGEP